MKLTNNDILIELLTKMKIEAHFKNKTQTVTMKLTDLYQLCINLLKLEGRYSDE